MAAIDEDAQLVRRTLAGDQTAFTGLVDRYHGEVYNLAIRSVRQSQDAEDITQEAFIRAFRALASFDVTRPFGAWMYAITARLCIDFHRRKRLKTVSLTRPEEGSAGEEREWDLPDEGQGPAQEFEVGEMAGRLGELIEKLPPDYRIAILLRHAHDFSYEEIAQTLDTPLGTIKARIHRARAQLRGWLEGTELDPEWAGETEEGHSATPSKSEKNRPGANPDAPSKRKERR